MQKFADFQDCELLRLWYDENKSDYEIDGFKESGGDIFRGIGRENIIILFSDYHSDASAGKGFNQDYTYTDWMWILIRDSENDPWQLKDWGY